MRFVAMSAAVQAVLDCAGGCSCDHDCNYALSALAQPRTLKLSRFVLRPSLNRFMTIAEEEVGQGGAYAQQAAFRLLSEAFAVDRSR